MLVLEKTLESLLDCEEIKPVNPKGNQPWTFIGRTDAKAEAPILWPPDAKSQFFDKELTPWKRPWCWETLRAGRERMTEREIVEWHHRINGHEFEQTPGESEEQRILACYSPRGHKSQTQLRDQTTTIKLRL